MKHVLLAVCVLLSPACGKNERPVAASVTASARDSIAKSRCEREAHCENIGDGKKFSSEKDCSDRIQADWKDDLNARECPHGVNQKQLDECLTAVRNEGCSSPLDSLERISACTVGQICVE